MRIIVYPSQLSGTLCVPPSKSMAHRMLICATLADGISHVKNLDISEDIQATSRALAALGAKLTFCGNQAEVTGLSLNPAHWAVKNSADCGESGSTLRFMIPLFALTAHKTHLTGAPRLFERPLTVYAEIFRTQNLLFCPGDGALQLQGPLRSGRFTLAGNLSSQFISGLLFALPLLPGDSQLHILPPFESQDYVKLTQSAQALFGVTSHWADKNQLHIPGGQHYHAADATVEGDWSQAGVPMVMAALKGPLGVTGLRPDSCQGDRFILDILRRCGAQVTREGERFVISPGEKPLHTPGIIDLSGCPDLGPILCVLALFCRGTTQMINAGRLRIKESDRIASMESELQKLGGRIRSTQDSITIEGGHPLVGGETLSHNDHRVVMALTAAAVCAGVPVTIDGAEAIGKSWPHFFDDMRIIGMQTEAL